MKKIAIYGAGGFGREVHMLLKQINSVSHVWEFVGYFDDNPEIQGLVNGYPVLGGLDSLVSATDVQHIVFAIGDPVVKSKLIEQLKKVRSFFYPVLKHPNVLIDDTSEIGEGSIICANVLITVNCKIGAHVVLNLQCSIGHDTTIGNYCSLMPAVNISGEVVIEPGVYIGTGAKVINRVVIGTNVIVGAGAVVTKDLPANCTAVGTPAKPIKFHNLK